MTAATEHLAELYRTMARIRAFEEAAERESIGGVQVLGVTANASAKVRGPLHLSIGQEAVAAGVCAHLQRADLLTSTHRGHGHTLAKGADVRRMMAELFGRAGGSNGGKGGSMHIADFSVGMLGANGVVAAGMPIAVRRGARAEDPAPAADRGLLLRRRRDQPRAVSRSPELGRGLPAAGAVRLRGQPLFRHHRNPRR